MKVLANKCVICGDASSEKEVPGIRGHEAVFRAVSGPFQQVGTVQFREGYRSVMVGDGARGPRCPLFAACSSSSSQPGGDVADDQDLEENRRGRIAINSA
jgi:hypothetical protein